MPVDKIKRCGATPFIVAKSGSQKSDRFSRPLGQSSPSVGDAQGAACTSIHQPMSHTQKGPAQRTTPVTVQDTALLSKLESEKPASFDKLIAAPASIEVESALSGLSNAFQHALDRAQNNHHVRQALFDAHCDVILGISKLTKLMSVVKVRLTHICYTLSYP